MPVVQWQWKNQYVKSRGPDNASLSRDAISDLWKNTLSQIPSVFGRLVYLSSLRDANTGRYEHYGLAQVFSEEDANQALGRSHSQVFAEWLSFNIEQQKADLDVYIKALVQDKRTVLETWLRLTPYRNLAPSFVKSLEKRRYFCDLTAILQLLMNEYDVSPPAGSSKKR